MGWSFLKRPAIAPQINSTITEPTIAPINPAPSPARYQPIACPRYVATRAPMTPRTAVMMKPLGSFREPGTRNLAIMPATRPMMMVQIISMDAPFRDPAADRPFERQFRRVIFGSSPGAGRIVVKGGPQP